MLLNLLKKIIFRSFFISLVGIGLLTAVRAADLNPSAPLNIRRIIVFGDSLSDNGNLYTLSIQFHKIDHTVPVIPEPNLYWHGRFSDGPVWDEYLASMFHFTHQQITSDSRASEQFQNYAYAGSWAEANPADIPATDKPHPPTLSAQVDKYLMLVKARHPQDYQQVLANDLVFIWTGGNDYLNQDFNGPPIARKPKTSTDGVIASIRNNLNKLILAGSKNLVLIGLPDLSRIPDIELRDPIHQSLSPNIQRTSNLHNQKLQQLVQQVQQQYPGVHINYLDVYQLFLDQFQQSHIRQQQYARLHQGKFQNPIAPCIIESNDPDPHAKTTLHLSRVLALAASSGKNQFLQNGYKYPQCDHHKNGDGASPFNYAQHYQAGGIFFDHIHPTTQIHAKIALTLCQLLEHEGYRYYQSKSNHFEHVYCSDYDINGLMSTVVNPPFPQK